MSVAGSLRVKVVQRKLSSVRDGELAVVDDHHQRKAVDRVVAIVAPRRKRSTARSAPLLPACHGGPSTTRIPGRNTRGLPKPKLFGQREGGCRCPPAACAARARRRRSPPSSPRSGRRRCSPACRSWCRSGSAGRAANRPAPARGGGNRARGERPDRDRPRRPRSTDTWPATTGRGPAGRWPAVSSSRGRRAS